MHEGVSLIRDKYTAVIQCDRMMMLMTMTTTTVIIEVVIVVMMMEVVTCNDETAISTNHSVAQSSAIQGDFVYKNPVISCACGLKQPKRLRYRWSTSHEAPNS